MYNLMIHYCILTEPFKKHWCDTIALEIRFNLKNVNIVFLLDLSYRNSIPDRKPSPPKL